MLCGRLSPEAAGEGGGLVCSKRRSPRFSCCARQHSSSSGFTLLELIVATAIMGLAVVGLLSLVAGALSNAAIVREYDRAAMLARSQMNRLLVLEPLPLGETLRGEFNEKSGWEARAEPFEWLQGQQTSRPLLVRVTLTIWWESQRGRKTQEFEGYRTLRIRREHQELMGR